MIALVTGAAGFLGGAIARALRERGDEVRGFSRGEHPELASAGITQHRGNLADREAVMSATRGVDIVFHAGAKVGAGGLPAAFYSANVTGTGNVIAACRECGVTTLVYTSTPSVLSGLGDLDGVDESVDYPTSYDADYGRTKAEAERLVLSSTSGSSSSDSSDSTTSDSSASDDFRTVAIRPPLVWGPGDTSLLPRLVERGKSGALRRIAGPPKRQDITYIDDAVRAHLLAGDILLAGGERARRVDGRPYFVSSGEPVEIWDFVNGLLEAAGIAPLRKSVSLRTALVVGWVFEKAHAISGKEGDPRMSRWIVRQLTSSRWFDISAARRDLGYEPQVSLEEGIRRLKAWLQKQKQVQERKQESEPRG